MPRNYFYVNDNTNQDVDVKPDDISASGENEYAILNIPFKLNLRPITDYNRGKQEFELLSVKAVLRATDKNFVCSQSFSHIDYHVQRDSEYTLYLEFPITRESLMHIEKWRKENLKFSVTLDFLSAIYVRLGMKDKNNQPYEEKFVSSFSKSNTQVDFIVQQSHWIKNVLPKLGYDKIRLIEIPNNNDLLNVEYEKALKELQAADDYFVKGDYDKTVSHCRAAVEAVKKKLPTIKENLKSDSEFDWIKKVYESTDLWIETMTKATWQLTSKTHHFPTLDHFSREQAEIIRLITVGIVAFAGRVEVKK